MLGTPGERNHSLHRPRFPEGLTSSDLQSRQPSAVEHPLAGGCLRELMQLILKRAVKVLQHLPLRYLGSEPEGCRFPIGNFAGLNHPQSHGYLLIQILKLNHTGKKKLKSRLIPLPILVPFLLSRSNQYYQFGAYFSTEYYIRAPTCRPFCFSGNFQTHNKVE